MNWAWLATVFIAACAPEPEPEIIDTNITEDRTLINRVEDPSLPDYLVTAPIAVWAAVDVDPGVRIAFANDAGMWIGSATGDGSFNAAGTEAEPILLTAETPAGAPSWMGIGFGSSSVDNRLEFVTVEYAGSAPANGMLDTKAGVTLWDGTLAILDSTLQDNLDYGFAAVTSPGEKPNLTAFERNTLTENGLPALLTTNLIGSLDSASSYTGNDTDFVDVAALDFDPGISEPTTIQKLDVPYRLSGEVGSVSDLSLNAGTQLIMAPDSALLIGSATGEGSLAIDGTAEEPVRIEGELQTAGSWGGILINSGSVLNAFDYLELGYGGNISPLAGQPANIVLGTGGGGGRLSLTHSTIHDSAGFGVYVVADSVLDESDNTYSNNAGGEIGADL